MKINFDVSTKEFNIIQTIFQKLLNPSYKVWVFGSRAKNKAYDYSDLDLALEAEQEIDKQVILQLKDAFEDSLLPYTVDVLDLNAISSSFRKIVNQQKVQFPIIYKNTKIPLVRFPEFEDEWEHKELNEFLSESKKKNTNLKYSKEEVLSVSGELGIVNQIEHLGRSYAGKSVHNYGVVEIGDIVYTKSPLKANPYGIIKINKGKAGIVSTLYATYKVNEQTAYGDFLDYYFSLDANTNRYLRPLVRKGAKNTLQVYDKEAIKGKIFLPQVTEQKRIANFFSVLDNKITQLKEKKALLEDYKKGMMQKIFSQEVRFKDDDGKEFAEWEEKKLGEVGAFQTSSVDKLSKENEKQIHLVNYMNVYRHENINTETLKTLQTVTANKNQLISSNLKRGDILFTPSSETPIDIGHSIVIFEDLKDTLFSYHLIRFRPKIKLDILYSHYFCNIPSVLKQLSIFSTGSTRFTISVGNFSKVKIYLPTLPEQTKIANFLSKIDDKIKTVTEQIEESKEYKKGLLQKMYVV